MFVLFSIIIILACVFLTLVVLIQNPKGGGIASNFTAPNQIMGARRSTDVVEKTTWILAIVLISFSLLSNFFRPIGQSEESGVKDSRIKGQIEEAQVPNAAPTPAPAPAPENQQADPNAPAGEPQTQPQQP
jgi:preprotein translocase subunit SecG